MKRLLALTVFAMITALSAGVAQTPVQAVRVDAFGDTLPPGALFRLGCTRLHHLGETSDLRFSTNGRNITTLDSTNGMAITWDVATGKEKRRMKLQVSGEFFLSCQFSARGDRIAAIGEDFLLFSATDGKLLLRMKGDISVAHVSADGKKLILLDEDGDLRHLDARTGRVIKSVELASAEEEFPTAFSPDGKWLAAYHNRGKQSWLQIWHADNGKRAYLFKEKDTNAVGFAFSPDGRFVAGAFYRRPEFPVIIWDLKTGKEVQRLRVKYAQVPEIFALGGRGLFDFGDPPNNLRFSADGGLFAYVERSLDKETVWVWDVKTGKVRHQLKAFLRPLSRLLFSPDGEMLAAVSDSGSVLIWNLTSGKLVNHDLPEVFDGSVRYGNGGRSIVVRYGPAPTPSAGRVATGVWDVGTGRRVLTLPGKALADVSSTGQLLAIYDADRQKTAKNKQTPRQAEIVDLASGKTRWQSTKLGSQVRFSSDGKKLASFGPKLQILDARTGKELSRFQVKNFRESKAEFQQHAFSPDLRYAVHADSKQGKLRLLDLVGDRQLWQSTKLPTAEQGSCIIRFSPDCELLAVADYDSHFSLWQTKTGKQLFRGKHHGTLLGFLPDRRTVLFQGGESEDDEEAHVTTFRVGPMNAGNDYPGYIREHTDHFYEDRDTLEKIGDLIGGYAGLSMSFERELGSVASADSKILVTSEEPNQTGNPHLIQVWETATGKVLCRLQGERDGAQMPVLSPDCRTITTRNANNTITVWDITGLRLAEQKGQLPVSPAEFEGSWKSFGDRDGQKFFRAFWKLAADPDQTVTRLGGRLKPVATTIDPKRISQWIADLDNKEFAVRARAANELERDETALPILHRALEKKPSLEARRRLTRIVEKLEAGPKRSPEALRVYRLVQLLEQIGSAAARDLLRTLSHGAEGAMLTREARASLRRLGG